MSRGKRDNILAGGAKQWQRQKTSSAVKRRYNNKVYSKIQAELPKDLVATFKEKCAEVGVSQASVFKEAMENFIAKH